MHPYLLTSGKYVLLRQDTCIYGLPRGTTWAGLFLIGIYLGLQIFIVGRQPGAAGFFRSHFLRIAVVCATSGLTMADVMTDVILAIMMHACKQELFVRQVELSAFSFKLS